MFKFPFLGVVSPCLFALGLVSCGGGGGGDDGGSGPAGTVNAAPTASIAADATSGVVTLQVNLDARGSSDPDGSITAYAWDFGDGTTDQSPTAMHSYSQAGTYTVRLTVTDNAGDSDTTTMNVYVFASLDNTQVIVPQGVLFFDDFEYAVTRDQNANNASMFTDQGGWGYVKSINTTGSWAGNLYTASTIPGYSGSFPGSNSDTVLVMESLAGTLNTQTDFYLQYGQENGAMDAVPGDVWFQFWMYPNRFGDQMSAFGGRFKFLYPCKESYPCTDGNYTWLHTMGFATGEPHWANEDNTQLYMTTVNASHYPDTPINYQLAAVENKFKIGQTDVSEHIAPNRWTLVKLHFDTSTASGAFEAWLKPMGGDWVKVADWVDGTTENFSWIVPTAEIGGHRMVRMPTTLDSTDSWIYMDDFAMAGSEAELPIYPY